MTKPVLNLNSDLEMAEWGHGDFAQSCVDIGGKIGAKKLGYNLTIVPPGKKSCPFHNHHANEEFFLVLEGTGTLRFGDETYSVKENDCIACPAGGKEVAHQLINTGEVPLKYLSLSTKIETEVVEYPDSQKVGAYVGNDFMQMKLRHISKVKDEAEYFEGES